MQSHATPSADAARRHRPRTLTVFAAAFAAGAVLAYGVNRVVDVHVVRVEPQVESEPIFVALRSLPQGSPVTVWDVALKDWPKAMLPTTALRADACLEGMVLRHPIREGQPLLSVQLVRDVAAAPMTAIVTTGDGRAPTPADAGTPAGAAPTLAATGTITERFVPATPAEPAAGTTAEAGPAAVAENSLDTAATAPPAEPAPTAEPARAVEPTPVVVPAPTAAIAATTEVAPTTVPMPRSTDVDEPAAQPVVASQPAITAVEPTPAPRPVPLPLPAPAATESAPVSGVAAAPLAAPVPALPSTDIGSSLVTFGRTPQPSVAEKPQTERHESVLDRTTEAAPPTVARPVPKHHLVVPERIALAADASFTQRPTAQPDVAGAPSAARDTRAGAQAKAPSAQARGNARRPPAPQPSATRQPAPQPQRQQPAARPQSPPSNRGLNAWLPRFMGESRQR